MAYRLLTFVCCLIICIDRADSLLTFEHILCNESIELPSSFDESTMEYQHVSITLCNISMNLLVHPNEQFFSRNLTMNKTFKAQGKRRFVYIGRIIDEQHSSVSLIVYPQLQIYIYMNKTYYYSMSLANNLSLILTFTQQQLLQYYPLLVHDSLWKTLQSEEDAYQKNSIILHDLHFIYELLTMRCQADHVNYKVVSYCSLALYVDQWLYERVFASNIYFIYNYIEHFNFLLRTLTNNDYGGFLLQRLELIAHADSHANSSFDMLRRLANDSRLPLKEYCLNHQMFLSETEKDSFVVGYQSSVHTYDIGGICSSPFYLDTNRSDEINLNTGLSMFNENTTGHLTIYFNSLMKTSYLFLRQMGLNLTLCSINATRRAFFQFNTNVSPAVSQCMDLLSTTLQPALKRRAHLCFTHINMNNRSYALQRQQLTCQQTIDLPSSVPADGQRRKSPYIENALNNNRRGEWFEGNIVGIILTLSLVIWIPVSCFVHFCIDEINKTALLEKQQQDIEALPMRSTPVDRSDLSKQTQTE
jgi:hypothetical protein